MFIVTSISFECGSCFIRVICISVPQIVSNMIVLISDDGRVIFWMLLVEHELITHPEHLISTTVLAGFVFLSNVLSTIVSFLLLLCFHFSLLCFFLLLLFAFVPCLVYPKLPMSLDCLTWIASSVFSDVYVRCTNSG